VEHLRELDEDAKLYLFTSVCFIVALMGFVWTGLVENWQWADNPIQWTMALAVLVCPWMFIWPFWTAGKVWLWVDDLWQRRHAEDEAEYFE
jgi:hypothetical protein